MSLNKKGFGKKDFTGVLGLEKSALDLRWHLLCDSQRVWTTRKLPQKSHISSKVLGLTSMSFRFALECDFSCGPQPIQQNLGGGNLVNTKNLYYQREILDIHTIINVEYVITNNYIITWLYFQREFLPSGHPHNSHIPPLRCVHHACHCRVQYRPSCRGDLIFIILLSLFFRGKNPPLWWYVIIVMIYHIS